MHTKWDDLSLDERIDAYLDGAALPEQAALLEREVARSPAAGSRLAEMRALFQDLRRLDDVPAPKDVTSDVVAAISARPEGEAGREGIDDDDVDGGRQARGRRGGGAMNGWSAAAAGGGIAATVAVLWILSSYGIGLEGGVAMVLSAWASGLGDGLGYVVAIVSNASSGVLAGPVPLVRAAGDLLPASEGGAWAMLASACVAWLAGNGLLLGRGEQR